MKTDLVSDAYTPSSTDSIVKNSVLVDVVVDVHGIGSIEACMETGPVVADMDCI